MLLSSAWFLPALFGYILFTTALIIPLSKSGARQQAKKLADADRDALEVTGNLAAAETALDKMVAGDMPMLTQISKIPAYGPARMQEETRAGGILLRRLELQKTAQALGLAPGTEAGRNATG